VRSVATALAAEHPAAFDRVTLTAEPFGESWRVRFRLSLYTLLAAAGLLLLIACANVATLLLARLAQRESELTVRIALGAPRRRILRQLLLESLMVAAAGGAAGLALAAAAVRVFAASGVFALPPYVHIAIDTRAAVIGIVLVGVTGMLFGVLPAALGSGEAGKVGLERGARVSLGRKQRRYGQMLVVAQVAFTFVLIVGSTLLLRTYRNLIGADLGYRTQNLLRLAVSPDPNAFRNGPSRVALADHIKQTFEAYPGVRRTTVMAGVLPPWFDDVVDVTSGPDLRIRDAGRHAVGPDYFEVMGMTLLRGRSFASSDRAPGATSAVLSESLAQRLTESTKRDAIGQRVHASVAGMSSLETLEIIGVVNDVSYNGPRRARLADHDLYVPLERGRPGALSIAVHTGVDPASLIDPLSRALGKLAPTSPQHWISTMEAELGLQYREPQLYASLSAIYGLAAAMLAVLGIYSVLANNVARRHRELGVRMAVGAQPWDIIRLVLSEGIRTVAVGLAIGTSLSVLGTRLLAGLLYGVSPGDVLTLLLASAGLGATGLVAALIPSLRASRVDPLVTLRAP
jgi:predicted permease